MAPASARLGEHRQRGDERRGEENRLQLPLAARLALSAMRAVVRVIGDHGLAAVLDQYRRRIEQQPQRKAAVDALSPADLLALYRGLLRFRLHDIALQRWVKQGVLSKAWLGTGEEAVTIGAVHALRREGQAGDVVGPMIRNAGACHEMGMSLADMLRGYLATADSPTGGKDLHVGGLEYGIVAPISMVGSLAAVMNGFALAFKKRGEARVSLTWIGDGATKHGEVHEALNFAHGRRRGHVRQPQAG
ncbi:MAG: thiamine pyrophosphate-dependent enzyme [Gemmatimonadales bacterium]